ncbi:MAG: porphobilinogen synthase [Rhodospirillaceae bacterium]|nr:porphobilinogen synthase [Rhodospirillaceae bacterium]
MIFTPSFIKKSTAPFSANGQFPSTRLRRNRLHPWYRRLLAENTLQATDLILPVFIHEGREDQIPIPAMPGIHRLSLDHLLKTASQAAKLGIPAIAIFPVVPTEKKSDDAKEAYNPNNLCNQAIRAIKKNVPEIGVICDVALDPYTPHGHDGLMINEEIHNDQTVEVLCKQALAQAEAGADMVAPSDMMDGRIGAIRQSLDQSGFINCAILSYAVKYASSFYGPFRQAVGSARALGKKDKRTYQMNPANSDEALRECDLDIKEGADILMVKPGLPYLDILYRVKTTFQMPTFVYQVSGEYAMIQSAGQNGWGDSTKLMLESLLAFKRAGANAILTYAALDVASKLDQLEM